MKRWVIITISLLCIVTSISAQSDVLYLKNGSKIKGSVLEMDPTNGVKIQTSDGSLFVYSMSDVDRVSKEDPNQTAFDKLNTYGQIERRRGNYYWKETGNYLTKQEYATILDDELLDTFESAHRQFNTGRTFWGIGLGCLAITCISCVAAVNEDTQQAFDEDMAIAQLFAYGADLGICLGCIFRGIGKGRLNWVKNTYNSGRSYSSTVNFAPSLMMTAQRDMGVGASVVLTF